MHLSSLLHLSKILLLYPGLTTQTIKSALLNFYLTSMWNFVPIDWKIWWSDPKTAKIGICTPLRSHNITQTIGAKHVWAACKIWWKLITDFEHSTNDSFADMHIETVHWIDNKCLFYDTYTIHSGWSVKFNSTTMIIISQHIWNFRWNLQYFWETMIKETKNINGRITIMTI